jgi:CBS-domain-containing membrane protein
MLNALMVRDVWELVVDNPSTIGPDASIPDLLEETVRDIRTRHVYVVDEQRHLLGVVRMFTVTELLFPVQALVAEISGSHLFRHVNVGGRTVREIMKKNPRSVRADTSMYDLARVLLDEKLTELPVIDEANVLIGQVNMYEIIKAYLQLRSE